MPIANAAYSREGARICFALRIVPRRKFRIEDSPWPADHSSEAIIFKYHDEPTIVSIVNGVIFVGAGVMSSYVSVEQRLDLRNRLSETQLIHFPLKNRILDGLNVVFCSKSHHADYAYRG